MRFGCSLVMLLAVSSHVSAATVARIEVLEPPPPGCIDLRLVEQTVEARLGEPVFTDVPDAVLIRMRFAHGEERPRAHLEIFTASGEQLGERELAADSCGQLQASLPVVIAVLLDLGASAEPAAPSTRDSPPPPAPPLMAADREPSSSTSPRRFSLAVLAEGVTRIQPRVGFGVAVEATIQVVGPLEASAWGDLRLPSSMAGTPSVAVRSLSAGAGLCLVSATLGSLSAGACVGGGILSLWANGHRGFSRKSEDSRSIGELRAIGRLDYPVAGPLRARIDFGVIVPTTRLRYGFEGETTVYRLSAGALGRVGLAIGW